MPELYDLSALELRKLYQKREVSPVEVTEVVLNRIEQLNPSINAFITLTPELAIEQAHQAEQAYASSEPPPPLAGIPTSLKDLIPTKGIRTTYGSLLYEDWVPDFNAPIVERLYPA